MADQVDVVYDRATLDDEVKSSPRGSPLGSPRQGPKIQQAAWSPSYGDTVESLQMRLAGLQAENQQLQLTNVSLRRTVKRQAKELGKEVRLRKTKAPQDFLRPSLDVGTASKMRQMGPNNSQLVPSAEALETHSPVTCLCFGRERSHQPYTLLACAYKNGSATIFRCPRTPAEHWNASDISNTEDLAVDKITVHSTLLGHSSAITSIFFSLGEDLIATTSMDASLRFWDVDSGSGLKVFCDSAPVFVASFMPCSPEVCIVGSADCTLVLRNVLTGAVLQRQKVPGDALALKFDTSGMAMFAGLKNGRVLAFEVQCANLRPSLEIQISRFLITCLNFVGSIDGRPPCLLVSHLGGAITIVDCIYDSGCGVLESLVVRHRLPLPQAMLPLKNGFSMSGPGYLVSGSERPEVVVATLSSPTTTRFKLRHHKVPVVAVAVNCEDSVLASGDVDGRIVLWRRVEEEGVPTCPKSESRGAERASASRPSTHCP